MVTSWSHLFKADASHFSFSLCLPQWLHSPAFCWCCGSDSTHEMFPVGAEQVSRTVYMSFRRHYSSKDSSLDCFIIVPWTVCQCRHTPIEKIRTVIKTNNGCNQLPFPKCSAGLHNNKQITCAKEGKNIKTDKADGMTQVRRPCSIDNRAYGRKQNVIQVSKWKPQR